MAPLVEPVEPRILFASSAAAASAAGTLDTRFAGGTGSAVYSLPGQQFSAASLITQSDGKLVVAGTTRPTDGGGTSDFAVLRFNADGSPDASFGTNGLLTLDFRDTNDTAGGVIQLAGGKLLVFGASEQPGAAPIVFRPDTDLAVARLNADGSLDTSFDSTGKLVLDLAHPRFVAYGPPLQVEDPTADMANAAAELPGGQLLIGGTTFADEFVAGDMFVMRLNADGSTDSTFGFNGTGMTPAPFNGDTVANAMLVQKDGKIVLGGADTSGKVTAMALVRLKSDGMYDPSFGAGGAALFPFSEKFDSVYSLAQQPDGKLLVGGVVTFGSLDQGGVRGANGQLALLRLTTKGQPDKTFGRQQGLDGLVLTGVPGSKLAAITSVKVQKDGKILVGGKAAPTVAAALGLSRNTVLARFTSKGALDATFGSGGVSVLKPATTGAAVPSRSGTLNAAHFNNDIGIEAHEGQYRAFLYDGAGVLALTPGGQVRVLGSSTPAGGSDSSAVVSAITSDGVDLGGTLAPAGTKAVASGAKARATLTVKNGGNVTAKGRFRVAVYASPTRAVGGTPIYTTTLSANIRSGRSANYRLAFALPKNLGAGSYYLIAVLTPIGAAMQDINPANNVVVSRAAIAVKEGAVKGVFSARAIGAGVGR